MDREKIRLTARQLYDIAYDDSDSFDVIKSKITGTFRHGNENTAVIKRNSDGKFFEIHYRNSIKDGCDFLDLNFDGTFEEVFEAKETIITYK